MSLIDHIGIATTNLDEAVARWSTLLGMTPERIEDVPSERVRVAFFGHSGSRIELLEASDPDSPIARFLERRGPGVHHVCVRVDDIEAALRRAEEAGMALIPPGIRSGAEGRRVAFLHPRDGGGVLLELSEKVIV